MFAVNIQTLLARQIGALSSEADPMVEAWLRLVTAVAHVPFADEGGFIAGLVQILRKKGRADGNRRIVIDDPVLKRVLPGQHRSAAGRAKRCGDERVPAMRSFPRQSIHVRCFEEGLGLQEAQRVVTLIVGQYKNDVPVLPRAGRSCCLRGRFRSRACRNCRGPFGQGARQRNAERS